MVQNIIYIPWERTKDPWLCLMTTLVLFSLLWLFPFVSPFLTSLIKFFLWLKFSTGREHWGGWVGQGPAPFHLHSEHRVLATGPPGMFLYLDRRSFIPCRSVDHDLLLCVRVLDERHRACFLARAVRAMQLLSIHGDSSTFPQVKRVKCLL